MHGTSLRPRLCVFRSLNHIYAQIIDDSLGQTLVSVGTLDSQLKGNVEKLNKTKTSEIVGSSMLMSGKASCLSFSQIVSPM